TVSEDCVALKQEGAGKTSDAGQPFTPVRVWDARTGEERLALTGIPSGVRSATFSPDGRLLLVVLDRKERWRILDERGEYRGHHQSSSGGGKGSAVTIWDARGGKLLTTLLGEKALCHGAAWSPDGRRVVTAGHDHIDNGFAYRVQMWDAENGRRLFSLEDE